MISKFIGFPPPKFPDVFQEESKTDSGTFSPGIPEGLRTLIIQFSRNASLVVCFSADCSVFIFAVKGREVNNNLKVELVTF